MPVRSAPCWQCRSTGASRLARRRSCSALTTSLRLMFHVLMRTRSSLRSSPAASDSSALNARRLITVRTPWVVLSPLKPVASGCALRKKFFSTWCRLGVPSTASGVAHSFGRAPSCARSCANASASGSPSSPAMTARRVDMRLFLDGLASLTGNELVESRHAQPHHDRPRALVLPIPAVNAFPGRDQRTARLGACPFLIEHQIAAPAHRLGMAMKLGVELLGLGKIADLPGIDHRAAGLHLNLVFEITVIATDRHIDHVGAESHRVAARQRLLTGGRGNFVPLRLCGGRCRNAERGDGARSKRNAVMDTHDRLPCDRLP